MPAELDASTLRRALELYLQALGRHREELDSLNVYPVPDGDTGVNLLLTQQAVVEALPAAEAGLADLATTVGQASLMGARGNSGVILSQVLRALFERLARGSGPADLAAALKHAAREAQRAVARPAEGTVLTVLADAAASAASAAGRGDDAAQVIEAALEEGRASLARTREIHPDLRAAGVVDAGGRGLVLLLDALRSAITGRPPIETVGPPGPVRAGEPSAPLDAFPFAYEVQFLLEPHRQDPDAAGLRRALQDLGDSLVMVGGAGLYNVHVHVNRPGLALERGLDAGWPHRASIAYLPDRDESCLANQARAVRVADQACGLVAVAEGAGLRRTLESLGALVVTGGPGNNPSVGALVEAIEAAAGTEVIVLPNHRNVIPAAEQAAAASSRPARVLASRSIPGGIAAATAFNPTADLASNLEAMEEALDAGRAGEVARAERDARTPAGAVRAGQWMGIAGGRAVSIADDPAEAVRAVAEALRGDDAEIVTLVVGDGVDARGADSAVAALREALPGVEIQVVDGGQPRYPFLIGVE